MNKKEIKWSKLSWKHYPKVKLLQQFAQSDVFKGVATTAARIWEWTFWLGKLGSRFSFSNFSKGCYSLTHQNNLFPFAAFISIYFSNWFQQNVFPVVRWILSPWLFFWKVKTMSQHLPTNLSSYLPTYCPALPSINSEYNTTFLWHTVIAAATAGRKCHSD